MALNYQMKILVVDDFNVIRKMEIGYLNQLGFDNILEADDGETAIQILTEEQDIALVISDWNMPKTGGYELLVWVRFNQHYSDLPFIMATSQAEKKEVAKAVRAGVSSFLSKPFSSDELKGVIEEIFGTKTEEQDIKDVADEPKFLSRPPKKILLNVAHIQITDHLVLGVMKHLINVGTLKPKYFEMETRCMTGWNSVQKSLEKGLVDVAFILAPIAMDLFGSGVPIQLVLLSHKNGSICVKNRIGLDMPSFQDFFKEKMFYIPHLLSVHHMLASMFFREIGLKSGVVGKEAIDVSFEVVPPVTMPELLKKSPGTSGFMVAQPVGRKAITLGGADPMFLSGELWEDHPCCIVAVQKKLIAHDDAMHEFVDMLVQSGKYIENNPTESSQIAVEFLDPGKKLGLSVPELESVLTEPFGIRTFDLFPKIEELDRIQQYMSKNMGIGTPIDMEKFVNTTFAEYSCGDDETRNIVHIPEPSDIVDKIVERYKNMPDKK
ncbi:response regulator [Desulfobacterales bacterium HSG16]|nr:response regulator [Desulfobacterales bacterium HSG16]